MRNKINALGLKGEREVEEQLALSQALHDVLGEFGLVDHLCLRIGRHKA